MTTKMEMPKFMPGDRVFDKYNPARIFVLGDVVYSMADRRWEYVEFGSFGNDPHYEESDLEAV